MDDSLCVREAFEVTGGVRRGHFVVRSGHHTGEFWEKFAVLQDPTLTSAVLERLAGRMRRYSATHIAGPSQGGLLLAFELARQLKIHAVFVEKLTPSGGFTVQRGTRLEQRDRVVVVDDMLSSGSTLNAVIDAVRATGAEVVAVAVLIDRRATLPNPSPIGMPVEALLTLDGPPCWNPGDCPLCAAGVPLLSPRSMAQLKDGIKYG